MKSIKTTFLKGFGALTIMSLFGLVLGSFLIPLYQAKAEVVPALVAIGVSPSTICSGQSTHLSWSSTDASVSISPGIGSVDPYGERDVFPTQTTTYTITGTNSTGGYGTAYATVNVTGSCNQEQNPTVNLTADDSNIDYNDSTTLRWTSNNATSCNASGGTSGWSGSKSPSGSFYTGNITCSNNSGQASDSVTIQVGNQVQNPTVNLTADDTTIDFEDSTTIRWTSNNATSCNASGGTNGWSGSKSTSGSFFTGELDSDETYSITCTNNSGSASDSVTINVGDEDNDNEEPDVTTRSATNIDSDSATLNGRVDGNGLSTRAWFEWGEDRDLDDSTRERSYGSGSTSYDEQISGLRANTTYYFRAVAENSEDTVYGSVLSFRTDSNFVNTQPTFPTVVIYADQTSLAYNGATTVRWNTVSATSCFASGGSLGWAGAKSIGPGSFYTGSLTGSRTYTITCSNSAGSATDAVTVAVRGQVLGTTVARPALTSLVLITSSIDRNQPIVPTLDNTRPHPGDEINYTVSYQNIGTGAVTNLNLRLDLPYEVDYMFSNPNNPTRSGQTLIFNLGTLRANGQGTVTVRVRVRDNVPAGTNLNFPATLTYVDPSGFPQSVSANVAAQVWSEPIKDEAVRLEANVFGAGFLPTSLLGWLVLIVLLFMLILLVQYIFSQPNQRQIVYTTDPNLQ